MLQAPQAILNVSGPSRTLQDPFWSKHDPPGAYPTVHDLLAKSQKHQFLVSKFVNPIKRSKFTIIFVCSNAMNRSLQIGGSEICKKIAKNHHEIRSFRTLLAPSRGGSVKSCFGKSNSMCTIGSEYLVKYLRGPSWRVLDPPKVRVYLGNPYVGRVLGPCRIIF